MAEKITKIEAVRRALTELGNDAMPVTIQGWVKGNLGVEMTAGHVSTTKGQILRDAAKEKADPMPAAAPTPAILQPAATGESERKASEVTITKYEAVRRALAELGKNAKVAEIQSFVKEHFNIEITAGHAQTNKGKILREGKKKKPATKKPVSVKAIAGPEPKAQPSPAMPGPATANGKSIFLADLQTLKELIDRVGAKELETLINTLAN